MALSPTTLRTTVLTLFTAVALSAPFAAHAQTASAKPDANVPVTREDQDTALKNEEKANKQRAKADHEQRKAARAQEKAEKAQKKADAVKPQ